MRNRGFDGLGLFSGAADGLRCAKGLRTSRRGCSDGLGIGGCSTLKLSVTTRHKFAWPASVTRNMPLRVGQTSPT